MPEARPPITARQREVLDIVVASINEHGYPPTLREIGLRMGIRSTNGVNDHLKALEKKGYLIRKDLTSRSIRVVDLEQVAADPGLGGYEVATTDADDVRPGDRVFVRASEPAELGDLVLYKTSDGAHCTRRGDLKVGFIGRVVGLYRVIERERECSGAGAGS
jgi:SOS-response transcriptional repressor LexA